jgi:hypothetical protein
LSGCEPHQGSKAGTARNARHPGAASRSLQAANADVPACAALAPGHWRRIFFNTVPGYGYGLGYEEVDESGIPVPGTFSDVRPFDPTSLTVCLPLAAGNQPVSERWELVNLSAAVHNFHVHNAHFAVLTAADLAATVVPSKLWGRPVLMDNLPLRHADGHCATVADWSNGACAVYVSNVEISLAIAGDFAYHCHILAHEDLRPSHRPLAMWR